MANKGPRFKPFNPLDLEALAESTAARFHQQPVAKLAGLKPFPGAGVYALYYTGNFKPYKPIVPTGDWKKTNWVPIYVGEAGRKRRRKGLGFLEHPPGNAIYERLTRSHAESIESAKNLDLRHFSCRFLVMQDIFIPLCESALIATYKPIWNVVIDGFGNKAVGGKRETQQITMWDMLHPGRPKRATGPNQKFRSADEIVTLLKTFFEGTAGAPVTTGEAVAAVEEEELSEEEEM
jgi:hypothetical protein